MTHPGKPVKVDPSDLQLAADQLDGHASGFRATRDTAHARAGDASLGSGLAAAALPGMLAAWEVGGTRFDERFAAYAEGHRKAAAAYVRTDEHSASGIDDAGAGL